MATSISRLLVIVCLIGLLSGLHLSCSSSSAGRRASKKSGMLYGGQERLSWPVKGKVSSTFGRRWKRWHYGVDIPARKGAPVYAAASGRVVKSGWQTGYGKTVVVRHKSISTLYAHLADRDVKAGDFVRRGQVIGAVGNSGNARGYHLHFEVRTRRWTALNPLDFLPLSYL